MTPQFSVSILDPISDQVSNHDGATGHQITSRSSGAVLAHEGRPRPFANSEVARELPSSEYVLSGGSELTKLSSRRIPLSSPFRIGQQLFVHVQNYSLASKKQAKAGRGRVGRVHSSNGTGGVELSAVPSSSALISSEVSGRVLIHDTCVRFAGRGGSLRERAIETETLEKSVVFQGLVGVRRRTRVAVSHPTSGSRHEDGYRRPEVATAGRQVSRRLYRDLHCPCQPHFISQSAPSSILPRGSPAIAVSFSACSSQSGPNTRFKASRKPRRCSGLTTRLPLERTEGRRDELSFVNPCPRGSPVPLSFHSGAAPRSPCFTLVGSQDLDVKSRPNLSTPDPRAANQWMGTYASKRTPLCPKACYTRFTFLGKKVYTSRVQVSYPLVEDRPIMNAVKHRVVSDVVWTNRTMVSSNTDANRNGILAFFNLRVYRRFFTMTTEMGTRQKLSSVPGNRYFTTEIWPALNIEVLRADEGEARRVRSSVGMKGKGATGDPRENPPTSGIVRHDSPIRKFGSNAAGIEPGSPRWEASSLTPTPLPPPLPHTSSFTP
ncbi:hypothetical protein PR048_030604 [Dryococelus australis]|uniref:Uncharacterized protein n=1 Tax=Dryococelus australis TaxID=614101 RepID=A0ABQ9GC05_9NEOP|nr:hypothetical protein PR048_030604 [Dryococelus australis]